MKGKERPKYEYDFGDLHQIIHKGPALTDEQIDEQGRKWRDMSSVADIGPNTPPIKKKSSAKDEMGDSLTYTSWD